MLAENTTPSHRWIELFRIRTFGAALVTLLCAGFATAFAAAPPDERLESARRHILDGRAQQAVSALDPLERELAGNRDYDLLFAQALLNAGQPARALFPINRLTRRNPDDPVALLLLSRARMALGQAEPAKRALARAQNVQQPPEIANRINQYLSVIAVAEEAGRTRIGGYLELALGYDSNVNSATGASQIALPVFGGAIGTLNAAATKQSSGFGSVSGSVGFKYPLTAELAAVGTASASQRWNFFEKDFDMGSVAGAIGLRYTRDGNEWTAVFIADEFDVDYRRFRTATGGSLHWRRMKAPGREISAFAQYAQIQYPSQSLRDSDRSVIGIALGQALGAGARAPLLFASAYVGKEDERQANVEFFGHRLLGARLGIDKGITDRVGFSGFIAFENRDYGGRDPLFFVGRVDQQWDLRIATPFALMRQVVLLPQVSYTYNRSNVELFEYRRTSVAIAARVLF